MTEHYNNQVRKHLINYIELYNVNLKEASSDIKVNYTNLISFKNNNRKLNDESLKKICRFIRKAADKQAKLNQIINELPFE